jgi:hypothetical membrane protein
VRFVFPGAMWLRGMSLATIVMGLAMMVGTYREGDPWGDVVSSLVFVFLGYVAWSS